MTLTSPAPGAALTTTVEGASPRRIPYEPSLDGLRGLAVLAVLLYHGGVTWAAGGHLGVDAFLGVSAGKFVMPQRSRKARVIWSMTGLAR